MKEKVVYITPMHAKRMAAEKRRLRNWYIQTSILAFVALVLVVIAVKVFQDNFDKDPQEGTTIEQVAATPTAKTISFVEPEPEVEVEVIPEPIEYYFNQQDLEAAAKALWGEARGCSYSEQAKVIWVMCNRVDHGFGNSIYEVATAYSQFHGYNVNNPLTQEQLEIAQYVLINWSAEKQGYEVYRELGPTYLYFFGDGTQNHFREVWTGG